MICIQNKLTENLMSTSLLMFCKMKSIVNKFKIKHLASFQRVFACRADKLYLEFSYY